MVEVTATVIRVSLTLEQDVDSFTVEAQATLEIRLREALGCHEPACRLTLRVSSASVSIVAALTIPETTTDADTAESSTAPSSGNGTAAATAAAVEAAASSLLAQPITTLSADLGVSVASVASLSVSSHVSVPLVVAPPPPLLPPSPSVDSVEGRGSGGSSANSGIAIGLAVAVPLVIAVLALLFWRHARRARPDSRLREARMLAGRRLVEVDMAGSDSKPRALITQGQPTSWAQI